MNFNYQLKLSRRRKTVAISVKPQGVVVHAPYGICEKWLKGWLLSKQAWVEQKQQLVTQKLDLMSEQLDSINIYGQPFALNFGATMSFIDHQNTCVHLQSLLTAERTEQIREIHDLLSAELTGYLEGRLPYFESLMGSKYKTLKVRFYKRRWGSLSSKGVLAFNSALACAPKWVIDYVIVHELAHYYVMAHNRAFWDIVRRYYPEFKKAKTYLKEHVKVIQ
ncbi:M48 family metallopeptidase [Pseudoalteromonas luteoviolacea]|uniref:YgjP-like metallopeptidase domain-containing protein n=1 Tax=Pseudoalteromonas luteoviolacea S4054 TaxID=1129367 RepID=A0A0F6AAR1_9GAMM|nr:YgjP-like metallopeptidase domain-containing protein [Pseudoalteromonas luteoviolacea]AOT09089.1 hypothetical protein S4054249_15050 [Pseudoalteromonas luteoviolacea]AOT14002.1 hypothetical protein S40542_15020 [Pseudoalteromonas luteoviolacea]AOT18917.1 hypothetical protein S4054_15025 [Pseudoalteromonas luteoviolacea]KKE83243.1 hypothetical protein N479_14685 [Pseudoalteromonas luteoviolacea S4054]KZN73186.1 hypothetical protein N481_12725 [Pseudoalteromonas luteoviolacea S4047-1]